MAELKVGILVMHKKTGNIGQVQKVGWLQVKVIYDDGTVIWHYKNEIDIVYK